MKRILVFSLAYHPIVGGAEIALGEVARRLAHFEFHIVTLRFHRRLLPFERSQNIFIYRVGVPFARTHWGLLGSLSLWINKLLFPLLAYRKGKVLHLKQPYDMTWAIMANRAGLAATFFKKKYRSVPFLLTLQEGDSPAFIRRKTRFIGPLFRSIFKSANHAQVISNYLKVFALANGYRGPVSVIANGVDVARFANVSPEEALLLRRRLGYGGSDVVVITTSRLVPKNAVGDLIQAFSFLPSPFSLLVVGDGPERHALGALVKKLKLEGRVRFVGEVPYDAIAVYLRASDIFARPSRSEGFGNAFIEAMAAGLPVVATQVGGIPDFLENQETGLFTRAGDPKELSRTIEAIAHDQKLRAHIVGQAFELVKTKYDWNVIAGRMQEVFDMVLKSGNLPLT